jgi:hypothetical protein
MKTASLFRCALLLLCAACGSSPPYAAYADEGSAELTSNVVVADKYLRDVIRVGRPNVTRDPGTDNLRVRLTIHNVEYKPVQLLVQVEFRDRDARPIGDSTNRQVMNISPGTVWQVDVVSVRPDAMDYLVRIAWN